VKVLDVSKLPSGQPYLVMEYLQGEDLSQLLEREGPNGLEDVARAVHFVLQVLRGLQVAHQAGIIHRDLKPANCFVVNREGEPDFIKIVDFGISKVQQTGEGELHLTQEGSTMGTPLYVSLEQARDAANVDQRSDLYSVTVILYELLCGHTPFMPRTMPELFIQLATVTPQSLDEVRDLPPGLAALVQKGLAKNREDRFQSASEMAFALSTYADERSELVLRQLLQRGSARVSRAPSSSPPYDAIPPASLQSPPLPALPGRNLDSGTLHSVSKSHVVAGRSIAIDPAQPVKSKSLPKVALGAGLAVLLAAGGWFAFGNRAPATNSGPEQAAEPPHAAAPAERAAPASAPTVEPAAVLPTPASSAVPSASASVAPAAVVRPRAPAPQAAASTPAPEQKQAAPQQSGKPLLKKIGIQD